jgi:hypothetical protein
MPTNKKKIFLSYSHQDAAIAKSLYTNLKGAGASCFMAEKDISAGELWEEKIRRELVSANYVLILVTPRSKNSLWVAAEAGAAWVLEKPLVAALMFVDPNELIEPIKKRQWRIVETQEQIDGLINELLPPATQNPNSLTGRWIDPSDGDTVYFKQVGNRVLGFYDYGSGNRKVGMYAGILKGSNFEYKWNWLNNQVSGKGVMILSEDGNLLSGKWWNDKSKNDSTPIEYKRVSDKMPEWISNADFSEHTTFFEE